MVEFKSALGSMNMQPQGRHYVVDDPSAEAFPNFQYDSTDLNFPPSDVPLDQLYQRQPAPEAMPSNAREVTYEEAQKIRQQFAQQARSTSRIQNNILTIVGVGSAYEDVQIISADKTKITYKIRTLRAHENKEFKKTAEAHRNEKGEIAQSSFVDIRNVALKHAIVGIDNRDIDDVLAQYLPDVPEHNRRIYFVSLLDDRVAETIYERWWKMYQQHSQVDLTKEWNLKEVAEAIQKSGPNS